MIPFKDVSVNFESYIDNKTPSSNLFKGHPITSMNEETKKSINEFLFKGLGIDDELFAIAGALSVEKNAKMDLRWMERIKKYLI